MKFPKSEFWNYSSQVWLLPNIEKNCLALQNDHEVNINILLYCCWVGDKNLIINDDNLQALLNAVQPWQEIVEPLRESRKMMQQNLIAIPANTLSQTIDNINEMEINTEHMTQLALEKALKLKTLTNAKGKTNFECSLSNIETYIRSLGNIDSNETTSSFINGILNSIFETNNDEKSSAHAS